MIEDQTDIAHRSKIYNITLAESKVEQFLLSTVIFLVNNNCLNIFFKIALN